MRREKEKRKKTERVLLFDCFYENKKRFFAFEYVPVARMYYYSMSAQVADASKTIEPRAAYVVPAAMIAVKKQQQRFISFG